MCQLTVPWRAAALPRPYDKTQMAEGLRRWRDAAATAVEAADDPSLVDFAATFATDPDGKALLEALFGNSPYLGQCALDEIGFVRRLTQATPDTILAEVVADVAALPHDGAEADLSRALRLAKRRVALLTAIADIAGLWALTQVTAALSRFAEAALQAAARHLLWHAQQAGELQLANAGDPEAGSGFSIIGMGKLGARELNYSSDIDLMVLYDQERVRYVGARSAQDCFVRLARSLVRIMQERTVDGYVFRTDLRLRPDPGATPIALSMGAAENYYEALGQNWERAAMIKARCVAGDKEAGEAYLIRIAPFIWRRHLDYAAIEDIHSIKRQIQAFKGHGEVTVPGHDIKVGRGGIREIEFFVQTQQLIAGGRDKRLRIPDTLGALAAFVGTGRLAAKVAAELTEAYRFLRRLEHRLQMIDDEQTHRLPDGEAGLDHIATFLGYADTAVFCRELLGVLDGVRRHYAALFETAPDLGAGPAGSLVFTGTEDDPETLETLARLGFSEPARVAATVRGWHHGRYRAMRSVRARELLTTLMPKLLRALGATANPDDAFRRFDGFLGRLPAGVQLFSLFHANPSLLELLAEIMGTAPNLAELLAQYPALLDAVLAGDFETALPDAATLTAELEEQIGEAHGLEEMLDIARRWTGQRRFQAGVQLLMRKVDAEAAAVSLSAVADAVLAAMQRHITAEFVKQHGAVAGGAMIIIGMGKLGAREMTFTSDLDLIFVYDHNLQAGESGGRRPLPPSQYFARLSQRIINGLTVPTAEGPLYDVDMRLRPSGNKGPVAVHVDGFARYQREAAWTWEHMALTRARTIAGPKPLRMRVEGIIGDVLRVERDPVKLRADVRDMHRRVQEQHGTTDPWNLKHVRGGLLDIEFIVQYLLLRHAHRHPTIISGNTATALDRLGEAGLIDRARAAMLAGAARFLAGLQAVLRLCTGGSFDEAEAPPGLKAALATAGQSTDFPHLKHRLLDTEQRVAAAFDAMLADEAVVFTPPRRRTKAPGKVKKGDGMAKQLEAGSKAPDFTLPTDGGGTVSLKELKGKSVVLYFYPKDDTSGCTREAIDFTTHAKAFAKAGAIVLGCSKDSVAAHDKFKKKHKLGVTLAADVEGKTCESYGVWVEKSLYGRKYMGIERATFLVDGQGKIAKIWRKVKVPGHAEEVLDAVKAL
jgi:glutamate-ammonia-ligase adenylyltransferase